MTCGGYPNGKTEFRVNVKCRVETTKEPDPKDIIKQAHALMDACYPQTVLTVDNPSADFILWDNI
jgi:hypothetical protein